MGNLLRTGSDWLEGMRKTHLSQAVIYTRGNYSVELNATPSKTGYDIADEYGTTVKGEIIDFLITATDLILNGQQETPKPGDQITFRVDDSPTSPSVVYEVMDLAGEGCYRYSDSYRRTLRVHTREVG